jgi:hypothetical protein
MTIKSMNGRAGGGAEAASIGCDASPSNVEYVSLAL